jgi:AbrB family looped-hinge helix DNA binding protein
MRITSKGQVTIPEAIRKEFGFMPNSDVDFVVVDGHVELQSARTRRQLAEAWVEQYRGSADTGMTTDEIMRLTRGED